MLEFHRDLLAEAAIFNARVNGCVSRLTPVVEARQQFMELRPLMKRVELYLGRERLFRLMEGEIEEMKEESNRTQIAGEAADVLMYGAALVPWLPTMSIEEKQKWLDGVGSAFLAEEECDISTVDVAVAIAQHKLDANYPPWAFQEIGGETIQEAIVRHDASILGLKALRKQRDDGWLSEDILVRNGFKNRMKHDPFEAYRFLSGVLNLESSVMPIYATAVASFAASG